MDWIVLLMNVLSAVLNVYMVLIFARIILSWFSMDTSHPVVAILCRFTDPYLNWFRRFRWLKINGLDFSPMAALLVLYFVNLVALNIRNWVDTPVSATLTILLTLVWSGLSFILGLLVALAAIRYLSILFRWNGDVVWRFLDGILHPLAYQVAKLTGRGKLIPYPTALLLLGIPCLLLDIGGSFGYGYLHTLLSHLPF